VHNGYVCVNQPFSTTLSVFLLHLLLYACFSVLFLCESVRGWINGVGKLNFLHVSQLAKMKCYFKISRSASVVCDVYWTYLSCNFLKDELCCCSCRAMRCIGAAYVGMRCLSVCLSVCLSRSWIMLKRINISSKFFHCRVSTPF